MEGGCHLECFTIHRQDRVGTTCVRFSKFSSLSLREIQAQKGTEALPKGYDTSQAGRSLDMRSINHEFAGSSLGLVTYFGLTIYRQFWRTHLRFHERVFILLSCQDTIRSWLRRPTSLSGIHSAHQVRKGQDCRLRQYSYVNSFQVKNASKASTPCMEILLWPQTRLGRAAIKGTRFNQKAATLREKSLLEKL